VSVHETPEEERLYNIVDPTRSLPLHVRAIKMQKMIEEGRLDPKLRKNAVKSRAGREHVAVPSDEAIQHLIRNRVKGDDDETL